MRFDKMKPLSGLALALGVLLAVLASRSPCFAEESVKPAGVAQAQPAPAPATPEQAKPPAAAEPETKAAPEESAVQIDVPSRPVAFVRGSSDWENGFKSIKAAFDKIDEALKKDGLAPAGHPFTVFTSTDDNGFKFEAMVPLRKSRKARRNSLPMSNSARLLLARRSSSSIAAPMTTLIPPMISSPPISMKRDSRRRTNSLKNI